MLWWDHPLQLLRWGMLRIIPIVFGLLRRGAVLRGAASQPLRSIRVQRVLWRKLCKVLRLYRVGGVLLYGMLWVGIVFVLWRAGGVVHTGVQWGAVVLRWPHAVCSAAGV